MMSITVNRIDNYNLVATLLLAVSIDGYFSSDFSATCPMFIVNAFRVSTGRISHTQGQMREALPLLQCSVGTSIRLECDQTSVMRDGHSLVCARTRTRM
mmetsp:Transcript_50125/g.127573  ORF Transcript_50125/g.127573 Transcript_50125/m.127573 type:complete len:99 (-) Transcript_50125:6-302(-)